MQGKVWKRGEELGRQGYTIIIHGKYNHAETQATHSHTGKHTKTLVVFDDAEAEKVYRQDLAKWPNNGWSLYGLSRSGCTAIIH